MQFGQLIPLVILAVIFAAGAFSRRQRLSTSILANVAVWVGIFAAALVGYTYRDDLKARGRKSLRRALADHRDRRFQERHGDLPPRL